jgi:hypothetical protein
VTAIECLQFEASLVAEWESHRTKKSIDEASLSRRADQLEFFRGVLFYPVLMNQFF